MRGRSSACGALGIPLKTCAEALADFGGVKGRMEVVPGVSSFLATAAALKQEYTLPGISQTVIITRNEGRTPVPDREKLRSLAEHQATMCIFLSITMLDKVVEEYCQRGFPYRYYQGQKDYCLISYRQSCFL